MEAKFKYFVNATKCEMECPNDYSLLAVVVLVLVPETEYPGYPGTTSSSTARIFPSFQTERGPGYRVLPILRGVFGVPRLTRLGQHCQFLPG
eukprot:1223433-Rhodomonas_salina.1